MTPKWQSIRTSNGQMKFDYSNIAAMISSLEELLISGQKIVDGYVEGKWFVLMVRNEAGTGFRVKIRMAV